MKEGSKIDTIMMYLLANLISEERIFNTLMYNVLK